MHPYKPYKTLDDLYNRFRDTNGEKKQLSPGLEFLETALIRLSALNSMGFHASQQTIEDKLKHSDKISIRNNKYEATINRIIPDLIKYDGNEHISRTLVEISDVRKIKPQVKKQVDERSLPHYNILPRLQNSKYLLLESKR